MTTTTKQSPKINIRLLRKVQKAILSEPTKFDMSWWFMEDDESPCGTAACIAGHAIAIERGYKKLKQGLKLKSDPEDVAASMLKITDIQCTRLFGASFWPEPFRSDYRVATSRAEAAKVAVARINHFIATGR